MKLPVILLACFANAVVAVLHVLLQPRQVVMRGNELRIAYGVARFVGQCHRVAFQNDAQIRDFAQSGARHGGDEETALAFGDDESLHHQTVQRFADGDLSGSGLVELQDQRGHRVAPVSLENLNATTRDTDTALADAVAARHTDPAVALLSDDLAAMARSLAPRLSPPSSP